MRRVLKYELGLVGVSPVVVARLHQVLEVAWQEPKDPTAGLPIVLTGGGPKRVPPVLVAWLDCEEWRPDLADGVPLTLEFVAIPTGATPPDGFTYASTARSRIAGSEFVVHVYWRTAPEEPVAILS